MMRHTLPLPLGAFVVLALAACGSTPPPPAPAPPPLPLVYAPLDSAVSYTIADTVVYEAQGIRTEIGSHAVVALSAIADSAGLFGATARITDFEGRFSNAAMGQAATADEGAVGGAFQVRYNASGEVTGITKPNMEPEFQQLFRGGDVLRALFPRLPASVVHRGAAWTDTVSSTETSEGLTTTNRNITVSTWTRDSVVAGRTLRVIESTGQNEIEVTGPSPAGEMRQVLEGGSTSVMLWDPVRRLLVSRSARADLTGSIQMPQMPAIPVTARLRTSVQLQP